MCSVLLTLTKGQQIENISNKSRTYLLWKIKNHQLDFLVILMIIKIKCSFLWKTNKSFFSYSIFTVCDLVPFTTDIWNKQQILAVSNVIKLYILFLCLHSTSRYKRILVKSKSNCQRRSNSSFDLQCYRTAGTWD